MDIRAAVYALDRGIDRIVDDEPGTSLLPPQTQLIPSEFGRVPELQRLLASTTLDGELDAAARPDVTDRELLAPGRFRAALGEAESALRSGAAENPDAAKVLNRGARLLADVRSLGDLLSQYRNALVQG
jgi:hypothetical protein